MNASEAKRIAIYCAASSSYAEQLIDGVLQYRSEHGTIRLRDFRYRNVNFRLPRQPPTWGDWQPHGILCNIGPEPGLAEWLLQAKLPIVNTTTDHPQELIPCVHGTGAAILAAEHLMKLELKQFGFVGHKDRLGSKILRENFERELQEYGHTLYWHDLKVAPTSGLQSLEETAAAEAGLTKYLRQIPKPAGIFALDDDFARVVCVACHRLGIAVPEDISVLGLEDTIGARLNDPPLSSIRPPGQEVGYEAMTLLMKLISGEQPPASPIMVRATKLIERGSTRSRTTENTLMLQAREMIAEDACNALRVEDVAAALDVSRSTLQHRYFEQFGQTPGDAIAQVRLERAKTLLTETDLSITTVSGIVGFSRSSIFSEFFKRQTGMTPRAFRTSKK